MKAVLGLIVILGLSGCQHNLDLSAAAPMEDSSNVAPKTFVLKNAGSEGFPFDPPFNSTFMFYRTVDPQCIGNNYSEHWKKYDQLRIPHQSGESYAECCLLGMEKEQMYNSTCRVVRGKFL